MQCYLFFSDCRATTAARSEIRKWSKLVSVKQRIKHTGTTDSDRLDDVKIVQVGELSLCEKATKDQMMAPQLVCVRSAIGLGGARGKTRKTREPFSGSNLSKEAAFNVQHGLAGHALDGLRVAPGWPYGSISVVSITGGPWERPRAKTFKSLPQLIETF